MFDQIREVVYRNDKKVTVTPKPSDLPEPILTENAAILLDRRYAKKIIEDGKIIASETPSQIYWRVADFISYGSAEFITDSERRQLARDYYRMFSEGRFLPNTPTIANAGKDDNAQLAACFVLPIEDSMESIFGTLRDAALIHKTGGGTGFSFSKLRPKDSLVQSTSGVASGPVSFLRLYNWMTEVVKQGGMRRGANMGILRVDHPDILEFIECKSGRGEITNFNISVAATDSFMRAVEDNGEYDLVDPRTQKASGKLNARMVWDKIVASAWRYGGEPGLFFIDKANNSTSNPILGWLISSTNPCGEQPIYDHDACNLGSVRLNAFYKENKSHNWRDKLDWMEFKNTVHLAIQFLDDAITMSTYPLPQITETVDSLRRIGLGPMGLADLLQLFLIPYDSDGATEVNLEIAQFFKSEAVKASQELAITRGAFPLFEQSRFYGEELPRRNANITTVAPTGSLSRLTDCEGGIEPPFSFSYMHGVQNLHFVNGTAVKVLKAAGVWTNELEEYVNKVGNFAGANMPQKIKDVLKTSLEIRPEVHVKIQSIWQNNFSESGVSKTINLPTEATAEDISSAFALAYKTGCKGITVYRYGSERESMMEVGSGSKVTNKVGRPFDLKGQTLRIKTPYGNAYFTLNTDRELSLFEGFLNIGKAGNEAAELAEAMARLLSLIGRMPSSWSIEQRLAEVIDELSNIGGKKGLGLDNENLVRSIPDGIAFCCKYFLEELGEKEKTTTTAKPAGKFCPTCQNMLVVVEGCRGGKCIGCGYSSC
ncbi:MAG: adenosylcobalamin-dependent ribonucleoside-diphosphate reductase [Candidatus Yanofskybacteria bacterium]|nr:adenosylcobalamin-dependent ribonucleoside-diphosphate reductase [Candidatus Yanofskybacteria bacterium]